MGSKSLDETAAILADTVHAGQAQAVALACKWIGDLRYPGVRRVYDSYYSGAGGMDVGFQAAGFVSGNRVDKDVERCKMNRRNVDGGTCFSDDLNTQGARKRARGRQKNRGGPALVAGGGPSCPWSSGQTQNIPGHVSLNSLAGSMDFVNLWDHLLDPRAVETHPLMILYECAGDRCYQTKQPELCGSDADTPYVALVKLLNRHDYHVELIKGLKASDQGNPTMRERAFVLGYKKLPGEELIVPSLDSESESDSDDDCQIPISFCQIPR